jgi:hypothetical protein
MSDSVTEDAVRGRKLAPGAGWEAWPNYEAAASGLENFWYPVIWASQVAHKPLAVRICDRDILLMRDADNKVRALADRCAHRGVRLSLGCQHFPGTISCP